MSILCEKRDTLLLVTLNRPEARNAVDPETAARLFEVFVDFDRDDDRRVAVLAGVPGAFCAGFDLKRAAAGLDAGWWAEHDLDAGFDSDGRLRKGPMGPTRLFLSKPVIAAVTGPAVAGGMELALWCDMRVMERAAYMGVYCRRWGVPLIDGGTMRLPRIVGHGRAMDLILTGRRVDAEECLAIGLANRLVDDGQAVDAAIEIATEIARFPQRCMQADRRSAIAQWSLGAAPALASEWASAETLASEGKSGAARFASGLGRSGDFEDI